ncbi:MAG TPA: hypothetical protein VJQ56_03025 [Blastocatellia bacterium]|nr:hypothetical protein [Blastocatellia bacterium]
MSRKSTGDTGTSDVTYDVVSVLYHALTSAETYDQYINDAEKGGEQEIAQFFRDIKEEDRLRAQRAKDLLGALLGRSRDQAKASS